MDALEWRLPGRSRTHDGPAVVPGPDGAGNRPVEPLIVLQREYRLPARCYRNKTVTTPMPPGFRGPGGSLLNGQRTSAGDKA